MNFHARAIIGLPILCTVNGQYGPHTITDVFAEVMPGRTGFYLVLTNQAGASFLAPLDDHLENRLGIAIAGAMAAGTWTGGGQ